MQKSRAFNVLLCLVLGAALLVPAVASAVTSRMSIQANDAEYYVSSYDADTQTFTWLQLGVSAYQDGTMDTVQNGAWVFISQSGPWGYRFGTGYLPDANMTIDAALGSATLDDDVDVYFSGWSTSPLYPQGPATFALDLQWAGVGDTESGAVSGVYRDWGRIKFSESGYESGHGNRYGRPVFGESGYGYGFVGRGPSGTSGYITKMASSSAWRSATVSGSIVELATGTDYFTASPDWAGLASWSDEWSEIGMKGPGALK